MRSKRQSKLQRHRAIRRRILRWYRQHGRDLPWRQTRDPYAILVSEIMLQQTQVSRVILKYLAWLQRWPTATALAQAPIRQVLKAWSGLGYNRRALALHRAAQILVRDFGGRLPTSVEELEDLPGVGPYTARAILVFSGQSNQTLIETNIRRVVTRLMSGIKPVAENDLTTIARQLRPDQGTDEWHHALMDLGAMICTSRGPDCLSCPVRTFCRAYPAVLSLSPIRKQSIPFTTTDRFWRGRIVALLAGVRSRSTSDLTKSLRRYGSIDLDRTQALLERLKAEGFLTQSGTKWQIVRQHSTTLPSRT